MTARETQLRIVGDAGVDFVLGVLPDWPRKGTETYVEHSDLRAGGSAANAAQAAAHYGHPSVRLLSAVGNDEFGTWLRERLADVGPALPVLPAPTTATVALLHDGAERSFLTTRGHLELISRDTVGEVLAPAPAGQRVIALFCAPFLLPRLRPELAGLLQEASARGHEVSLDTGWPPGGWTAETCAQVLGWMALCDHVLINELELQAITGEDDVERALHAAQSHMRPGATLVVKRGAVGAWAIRHGAIARAAAPAAQVFDTVGAGDSFNAAYLTAVGRGAGLEDALAAACRFATRFISCFPRPVRRPGADVPGGAWLAEGAA